MSEDTQGLASEEARRRLARDGPNRLPEPPRRGVLRIALGLLGQPMLLLLLATAGVYAVIGSRFDAAALLVSVAVVAGLTVRQEYRSERVLQALRGLASPRASVVRDGRVQRVAAQELVRGDRLLVQEGDRIAVDARLLQGHGLLVDESQLTGESAPCAKGMGGGAQADMLYAGTLVVQGDGVASVVATGAFTALGRIGRTLAGVDARPSRLQRELKTLVQRVAVLAVALSALAALGHAVQQGSWTAGALVGLTLAMAIIPEEFAVVWTVVLALGAWRLAQAQVLTRQAQAIEALGTASVLCVDKTGTLTLNRMSLARLHDGAEDAAVAEDAPAPAAFAGLLAGAARASLAQGIEPMDRAVFRLLARSGGAPAEDGWRAHAHEGVAPGRPYTVHHWRHDNGRRERVAVKGAPEAVLALCDGAGELAELRGERVAALRGERVAALRGERVAALRAVADDWSARGLRVLAVAAGEGDVVDDDLGQVAQVGDVGDPRVVAEAAPTRPIRPALRALGLLGFMDPLRPQVPAALQECRAAGVRVIMITGDSPLTAAAIARQAGLAEGAARVMTGAELDALDDAQLQQALVQVSVFARVDPLHKLRIVQALQRRGEVVTMTGDGVNDAPALRAADIGVAMGQRGTDVAREAADLVLLDDNFASLVDAVRAGRRIFVNLGKSLGYLFAVHLPIVGLSLLPLLGGGPALLLPLHVVLLELIIDPACSLVFEAEPAPPDLMRVPPRPRSTRLFTPRAALSALAVGAVALLAVAALTAAARLAQASLETQRGVALAAIVAANLAMLLWFRGRHAQRVGAGPNRAFDVLVAGVGTGAALIVGLPAVARALGLPDALPWPWALAGVVLAALALWRLRPRRAGALRSQG